MELTHRELIETFVKGEDDYDAAEVAEAMGAALAEVERLTARVAELEGRTIRAVFTAPNAMQGLATIYPSGQAEFAERDHPGATWGPPFMGAGVP